LAALATVAPQLEDLGYQAIWVSGGREPGVFDAVDVLISATERVTIATGILNIWMETPQAVSAGWQRIEADQPGRLFIGLGISHAPLIDPLGVGPYSHPVERVRTFLDDLDALPVPVPKTRRLLGALGPRMLELARERTVGSHPYLVTVANTAAARKVLGEAFLAVELGVVLEPDLERAREVARAALARYFVLPNYTRNWLRAGFGPEDLQSGGSDRLIDALVALGDADAIRQRIEEHWKAGADHVAVQVLSAGDSSVETFRALGPVR
jgi:probable F420-dependent oxidoreductase